MSRRGPGGSEADGVWQMMVALVWENRGEWRRKVSEVSGLPISRVRILRRLFDEPKTLKELVEMTGSDAPAITVAVNDLEERKLVQRTPLPDNRRAKQVSLTPAGRRLVETIHDTVRDEAPLPIQHLSKTDLAHLRRILERIT
ncbi:MAG TPA: MarR family transcriptional regulator [Dyella sp.]|uniref:MarR family winged helix-turn-helix transcriptional regulator n=1 Tax=Dyella sp. TaxID=1869338 RepID=UPI002C75B397|nr:MarR family transcriptional regulator [Dyella sp.]HTV83908.1 MarR family transcriptional regulator [Dyella sp.]